jgi:REP element-mobilizing transposase RayT
MTSPPPLELGQYYHIYSRGNNRENLFFEDRNYPYFLALYARHVAPVADTYAYCLLPNHFHLLVRIRMAEEQDPYSTEPLRLMNPSRQFGTWLNAYTKAINKVYGRTGSLFQNPFGRVLVMSDAHLVHLVGYIHQNPQRHGLVPDFRQWPYSSYRAMLSQKRTRVCRDEVLAWYQGAAAFRKWHAVPVPEATVRQWVLQDPD